MLQLTASCTLDVVSRSGGGSGTNCIGRLDNTGRCKTNLTLQRLFLTTLATASAIPCNEPLEVFPVSWVEFFEKPVATLGPWPAGTWQSVAELS